MQFYKLLNLVYSEKNYYKNCNFNLKYIFYKLLD